jgi:DNA-directed RNA polymerase subunit omega
MARITVEDCLIHQNNRFALVLLASKRAKQLLGGHVATTDTKGNKSIVSALREIAADKVRFMTSEEEAQAIAEEEARAEIEEAKRMQAVAQATAVTNGSNGTAHGNSLFESPVAKIAEAGELDAVESENVGSEKVDEGDAE